MSINRQSPILAGTGQEAKVVGTAFLWFKRGQTLDYHGESVYVIKLTGIDSIPEQKITVTIQIVAQHYRRNPTSALVEALKKATKIEDKRANFY
jgi:peptidylprolyl isomerase/peptidyl-prolyl cis-trans isomerase D